MTESNTIPHFYLMEEIDITELVKKRPSHDPPLPPHIPQIPPPLPPPMRLLPLSYY
jgi:hypothetical protein